MKTENIIEVETEYCIVCEKWKKGKFTILNFPKKYIPICKDCMDAEVNDDFKEHVLNGYRKFRR